MGCMVSLRCGGVKCIICMIKRSRLGSDDVVGLNNEKDVASVINSDAAFLEPLAALAVVVADAPLVCATEHTFCDLNSLDVNLNFDTAPLRERSPTFPRRSRD